MRVLFYPQKPKKPSKMNKILEHSGIDVTNDPRDSYDKVIYWSYHKTKEKPDANLQELMQKYRVINIGGLDITKSRVEQVQESIFGYNTIINPFQYKGKMIEKAEMQCGHKLHKIVDKVTDKQDGYIYCKLLDNRLNDRHCIYYRYFIFGDRITHTNRTIVPIKYRLKGGVSGKIEVVKGCLDLTKEEQEKIIKYTVSYRTEITELDVIRDSDGKIYVTDNNNVPGGLSLDIYRPFYYEWSEELRRFLEIWI